MYFLMEKISKFTCLCNKHHSSNNPRNVCFTAQSTKPHVYTVSFNWLHICPIYLPCLSSLFLPAFWNGFKVSSRHCVLCELLVCVLIFLNTLDLRLIVTRFLYTILFLIYTLTFLTVNAFESFSPISCIGSPFHFFSPYRTLTAMYWYKQHVCIFVLTVDDGYGFEASFTASCVGSIILVSGAHTTPYDCLQLCEHTAGCNVFMHSTAENTCTALSQCYSDPTFDSDYDTYRRIGKNTSRIPWNVRC